MNASTVIPAHATDTRTTGLRRLALTSLTVLAFAALTWVGAHIVIPIQPVPITLQTLFVLLAGAVVGGKRGVASQVLYTGVGAAGLPVFATGAAGLGVFTGPTGGFLFSFVVTPVLVSTLIRRSNRLAWHVGVFTLGTIVIFAMGVTHLALFYTHDLAQALRVGLLPFLPGAVFKVVAATSIFRSWRALGRIITSH